MLKVEKKVAKTLYDYFINLIKKLKLKPTRNATRCNNRYGLLHLSFTFSIFSETYI